MHFLCLHGSRTSSQIFGVQTAAIRYELGDNHTYDFVEGTFACLNPEISSMFGPEDTYYAYFDHGSPASAQQALDQLDDYISTEEPFDGIIAYSQGATLAATYIIRQTKQHGSANRGPVPLKCAIFFSSPAVYDYQTYFDGGNARALDPSIDGELIGVPTVHIWGKGDELKDDCERLSQLCKRPTVFIHEGKHEIPGLGTNSNVTGVVNAIRRGILEAEEEEVSSKDVNGKVEVKVS